MTERDKSKKVLKTARHFNDYEALIVSTIFQLEVTRIRKTRGIPATGFKRYHNYHNWFIKKTGKKLYPSQKHSPSEYSLYLDDIKSLCLRAGYSKHWESFIEHYVSRNEIKEQFLLRSGTTPYSPIITFSKGKIMMEVFSETTKADMGIIWPSIIKYQKLLRGKIPRKKRELSKYLAFYKIYKAEGESIKKALIKVSETSDFKEKYKDIPDEPHARLMVKRVEKIILSRQ